MSRSFDCVLFDFGGVFTVSPFGANDAVAAELGVEPAVVTEIVFGPYAEDTDHAWHRLERGEISLFEARETIMASALEQGLEIDPIQVLMRAGGRGEIHQIVVEKVRALRTDGYRTAMVTNNVLEFRDRWRPLLPLAELFDTVVDSSEVGVRKPNAEIFEIARRELGGCAAERCVFLDDFSGNIDAAERVGIRGVLVGDDPRGALVELDRILGGG